MLFIINFCDLLQNCEEKDGDKLAVCEEKLV